jgi:hypothetical protein
MANNSSSTRALEKMIQQALVDLSNNDFIYSFPAHSDLPFVTPIQNSNFNNLKIQIEHFFQQYPEIVNDIKNHFYDNVIMYITKRTFNIPFTPDDVGQTQYLLNHFFIKHGEKIQIIFDHFFDDLKPFMSESKSLLFRFLYRFIDPISKSAARQLTMDYLRKSGALVLTSLMYPDQMDLIQKQNKNLSKQSSSHKNKYFLLLSFFIMLCIMFGSEIFRFMWYYFLGIIFTVLALYLFAKF